LSNFAVRMLLWMFEHAIDTSYGRNIKAEGEITLSVLLSTGNVCKSPRPPVLFWFGR